MSLSFSVRTVPAGADNSAMQPSLWDKVGLCCPAISPPRLLPAHVHSWLTFVCKPKQPLLEQLPNEPTLLKNRRSPPSALDYSDHSPYRAHAEFNPSPRSSVSSSSVSGTPTSSASPAHPSAPLPSGLFLESSLQTTKATPASPHATPSLGLYPDTGVFSGLAFLSGRERDFGLTSFSPPTALTPPSATTALPLALPPSPSHIPTPAAGQWHASEIRPLRPR